MFLGTPLINWIFVIILIVIGCLICLTPFMVVIKLYFYLRNKFSYKEKKTTYIHFEKVFWRFRFSYYHLYGKKNKKTIRFEYSKGWDD
jgi:hypothetical protein